jgi:hypothetical protein
LFDRFGIVLHDKRMLWGYDHGFMLHWPSWTKRPIVWAWNYVACLILGHDETLRDIEECWDEDGSYSCIHCCKKIETRGTGWS